MTALARWTLAAACGTLVGTCVAVEPAGAQPVPAYTVTDLGTIGGSSSAAVAIKFEGLGDVMVGHATTADGSEHAWIGGVAGGGGAWMRDLGTFGGTHSEARAVNRTSTVVGFAQTADGAYRAFAHEVNSLVDLGTLGGRHSYALDISNVYPVMIVGVSDTAVDGVRRPFVYTGSSMSELPISLGGPSAAATAVNDRGHVAGHADVAGTGGHHAFLYADGVTHDLGSFGGDSEARAINDHDVVVGVAWLADASRRAFRYEHGVLQDLGTLGGASSEAMDVARDGAIVGWAEDASGSRRAVLWYGGVTTDLNTLIAPDSGWVLEVATGIDIRGGVTGYGRHDGQIRAFFLSPRDLRVNLHSIHEDLETNAPNPIDAGLTYSLRVTAEYDGGVPLDAVTLTSEVSGPVEIVWPEASTCVPEGPRIRCSAGQPLYSGVPVSMVIRVRATGPGVITHTGTVSTGGPDPNPANNVASETNTAYSLATLTAASPSVVGGQPLLMRTTLTSPVGLGGARVVLASTDPTVAAVPDRFDVVPYCCDRIWREFYVTTMPVSDPVTVAISATNGLVTRTVPITVLPSWGAQPPQPVTWADAVNVTAGPDTVAKTAGCDGCFDASVVSAQGIGVDGGAFEFTVTDPAMLLAAGLSDASGSPTSIDFAVSGGDVRENGVYRAWAPWVAGDVFRIAVSASGSVTYARNGQIFYTSATSAVPPLRAVVVLASIGARLDHLRLTNASMLPQPTGGGTPVTWATLVNAASSGDRLVKTGGCDGCFDAVGVSAEVLGAGGGAVEFTVVEPAALLAAGLSDANGPLTSVDFAIAGGDVRENGVYRAWAPWVTGDVFAVAVSAAGVVTYSRNGLPFYTSTALAVPPLRVVVVLATAGASLARIAVVGGTTPPPPATPVTWSTLINAERIGDGIAKSGGCDGCFDALAVAAEEIGPQGGAVDFTVVDPLRLLVAGLADPRNITASVDFGIRHGGASADVREHGVYRADTPVSAGDVFRIEVSATGVVTYARNGQVFHTSAVTATTPLRVVVVMADAGARLGATAVRGGTGPP